MPKLTLPTIAAVLAISVFSIPHSQAFDSYYFPLKSGKKVKIVDVFISTSETDQKKTLIVRYIPVNSSPDMWKHIVEMFDVATWFAADAKAKHIDTIGVTPLFDVRDPNNNTSYDYSVHSNTPVSADWRLEWQPWFHGSKG